MPQAVHADHGHGCKVCTFASTLNGWSHIDLCISLIKPGFGTSVWWHWTIGTEISLLRLSSFCNSFKHLKLLRIWIGCGALPGGGLCCITGLPPPTGLVLVSCFYADDSCRVADLDWENVVSMLASPCDFRWHVTQNIRANSAAYLSHGWPWHHDCWNVHCRFALSFSLSACVIKLRFCCSGGWELRARPRFWLEMGNPAQ